MPYVLHLRDASDATLDHLVALGALDVEHAGDGGLTALMPDSVDPCASGGGEFTVTPAAARDSGSVWTLHPRAVRIGRLHIVPAGMPAAGATTGLIEVRLMDGEVFGSGLHPTTALCLQLLSEIVEADVSAAMLDIGTGSGVLALAALKLGVPRVTAIDIDADAIRVADANARLNDVRERLQLALGGPEIVTGAFPLVAANVLAAPLIDLAPVIARRVAHHGRIVLSGIPRAVEDEVVRAYRRLGMHHVSTIARSDWTALLLQASW